MPLCSSLASKIMLKIIQAKFQQYMKWEPPDIQTGLRNRDQIANIHWIIEKARESERNISICFTDYSEDFHCVDNNKMWEILKEMGVPDHLTFLLRSLYVGEKKAVRIRHEHLKDLKLGKDNDKVYIVTLVI